MTRFLIPALTVHALLISHAVMGAESRDLEKLVRPFFSQHCTSCHGEKKQKGDLRVDTLAVGLQSPKIMGHWEEIMNRIISGDMPPEDEPQPKAEEISRVGGWIATQLREAEVVRQSSGERVTFHKLSRDEYANTIRDLLGVHFDAKGPTGLPEDPDWHGFERIGAAMTLSPFHVEKYLAAADAILDEALSLRPEPKRELIHWGPYDFRWKGFKEEYEARGIADKVRIEIVPNNYTTDTWNIKIPHTGDYLVRIKLSGLRPEGGRAPRLKLYMPVVDKTIIEQDVDAPEDKPMTIEARVHLTAGSYPVRVINSVPGPNPEGRRSRHSGTPNAFTTLKSRVPWQLKLSDDDFNLKRKMERPKIRHSVQAQGVEAQSVITQKVHRGAMGIRSNTMGWRRALFSIFLFRFKPIQPTLIIDSLEWDGPIVESWPTAAHQGIFSSQDARDVVAKFAERAWRRPVQAAEVEQLMGPYEQSKKLGESFEQSVCGSLVAVLCSDSFLYLQQGESKKTRQQLSDHELASRLSYFLWSTMPDQRLLDLAREGKLQPNLRSELKRMLADSRSSAFARSFPREWLQLRKVGMFAPDKALYPDYDENLEGSMIAETVAFFGEMLRRNSHLREFLDSDWTMLNERIAEHYGISGDAMQRVALKPEHHRGGLLTHGSVLSLTSDGTRHRPVHRGVWLLESIIGKPAPPPPVNVPALNTPAPNTKKSTVREKLEQHRADPNCTACHSKIDPLGIAFDNYDAIGRWRTIETVRDGTGADPKLDPSGALPDGRKFSDSVELRQILLADTDKFAAAFTEKRGVAGRITKTEAKAVTVALFCGDPAFYEFAYAELLAKGKTTKICVANDELRTWNPGVDGEGGSILDVKKLPTDGFGTSGYQITVSVSNMLEGFRRGRIVRLFLAGWKVQEQFYGESLMGYGFGRMLNQELVENVAKEYPDQFPFRTDCGNPHVSWYQLQTGAKPPPFSEHLVFGELIQADATTRSGQFRTDRTGEIVNFTLHEPATLKHLGNDAKLDALPTGQRYRFHLFQDDQGHFTRVAAVSDDFSHQTANHITCRILSIHPDALHIAWHLPEVKNYNGDMERPPDIGHSVLRITPDTRVWKEKTALKLTDLKPNDTLRFNQTAELPAKPAHAPDLWLTVDSIEVKK